MIHEQKKALRLYMLEILRQAAKADTSGRRSAALRSLSAALLEGPSKTIGIYYPMPHEVNLLPLVAAYPQHRFAFPRCVSGHQLVFHHVTQPDKDFAPGGHNIPAPAEHLPIIQPAELDILIVPGVAFSTDGKRLGYGGGYYDRYIPRCPRAKLTALAFAEQIVPHIPTDEHDCCIPHILHL